MEPLTLRLTVKKHQASDICAEAEFFVDSGIGCSVLSEQLLAKLEILATGEETQFLANGEKVVRKTGNAYFELGERGGYSKVMFGESGDMNLVGPATLLAVGLSLDMFTRELKPVKKAS